MFNKTDKYKELYFETRDKLNEMERFNRDQERYIEDLKDKLELKDLKIRGLEADKKALKEDIKYARKKALKYDELIYQETFEDEDEIEAE